MRGERTDGKRPESTAVEDRVVKRGMAHALWPLAVVVALAAVVGALVILSGSLWSSGVGPASAGAAQAGAAQADCAINDDGVRGECSAASTNRQDTVEVTLTKCVVNLSLIHI